jgi:hypothetical protein
VTGHKIEMSQFGIALKTEDGMETLYGGTHAMLFDSDVDAHKVCDSQAKWAKKAMNADARVVAVMKTYSWS